MLPDAHRSNLLAVVSTCVYKCSLLFKMLINGYFPCSWLCCYMTQLNPLIGPKLSMNEIMIMAREWGNEIKDTMAVTV